MAKDGQKWTKGTKEGRTRPKLARCGEKFQTPGRARPATLNHAQSRPAICSFFIMKKMQNGYSGQMDPGGTDPPPLDGGTPPRRKDPNGHTPPRRTDPPRLTDPPPGQTDLPSPDGRTPPPRTDGWTELKRKKILCVEVH